MKLKYPRPFLKLVQSTSINQLSIFWVCFRHTGPDVSTQWPEANGTGQDQLPGSFDNGTAWPAKVSLAPNWIAQEKTVAILAHQNRRKNRYA